MFGKYRFNKSDAVSVSIKKNYGKIVHSVKVGRRVAFSQDFSIWDLGCQQNVAVSLIFKPT